MLTYQNATIVNVPAKVEGTTTKRNFIFPQVLEKVGPTMIVGLAVPTKDNLSSHNHCWNSCSQNGYCNSCSNNHCLNGILNLALKR